jgi:tetratricopeptide (TPR) repeat protein
VRSHNNLGSWVLYYENPADAHQLFRSGIELGQRRGQISWVMWGKAHTLWTLFDLGRWDELLDVGEELLAWEREHGRSYVGAMALSYKAHVLARRGDIDAAVVLEDDFVARSREIGDPQVLHPATVIAAVVEHARGDDRAALAFLEEFDEASRPPSPLHSQHLPDALRVSIAIGSEELADRLIEVAETSTVRGRNSVLTGRAILEEAQGQADKAAQRYSDVAERWAQYGSVLEQGQTLLGAGRCLIAADRAAEAAACLSAAHAVFTRLGTVPLTEETKSLLSTAA